MNGYEIITSLLNENRIPFEHYTHEGVYNTVNVWHIPSDKAWEAHEPKSFSIALNGDKVEAWARTAEEPVYFGTDYNGAFEYVMKLWKKECIAKFAYGSAEYIKLETVAELLNMGSPNGYNYHVGNTYFDYGQRWVWSTILCDNGKGDEWQALNPRQQEEIIFAITIKDMARVARKILSESRLDKKGA